MEQQQIESDQQFMSDNGWQCVPYTSFSVAYQAMMMKRDKKSEDNEDDGDSELVKTIKRLRRNKINCQPRSDLGLSVGVQAMMMRGPMSMMDAEVETARVAAESAQVAQVAHLKNLASRVAHEAADKVASQRTHDDQVFVTDLLSGRYKKAPSSPIDIPSPPHKKGGKKRSTKKRTNAKKRSTKKRTNTKKRSYKKRN